MARRWYHEVSVEWLKARQAVLTATDVAGLLPEYKRYLKAGSPDEPTPGFSALWCKKHSKAYLDPSSSDAAARGHIMEPYAIESWNNQTLPIFHHWDDCIIVSGMFGFSPDAMTVRQHDAHLHTLSASDFICDLEVMEVKCYSPEQHMKSVIEDRMEHKELMQLAMAFVILDQLEVARLLWFCPDAPISMHAEEYTRDDLHDQIRLIMEIANVYQMCDHYWTKKLEDNPPTLKAMISEDEIYADYLLLQNQNSIFILK